VRLLCILGGIKKIWARISVKSLPTAVRTRVVGTARGPYLATQVDSGEYAYIILAGLKQICGCQYFFPSFIIAL
jgi:hypothetical protein